jgi:hypothetical protein
MSEGYSSGVSVGPFDALIDYFTGQASAPALHLERKEVHKAVFACAESHANEIMRSLAARRPAVLRKK